MGMFYDVRSLIDNIPGFSTYYLAFHDKWVIWYDYRDVKYPGLLIDREESKSFDFIMKSLKNIRKEIDYYLDAIWC